VAGGRQSDIRDVPNEESPRARCIQSAHVVADCCKGLLENGIAVSTRGECGQRVAHIIASHLDEIQAIGRGNAVKVLQESTYLVGQVDVNSILASLAAPTA